jgi:hypothetical protein
LQGYRDPSPIEREDAVTATLKENQIKGIPAGTYWFLNDYAIRMINKSILSDDSYKLPNGFLQKLINKSK